ncbi:MAG: ABC transporter substrate-binding protein, partial [Dehalococcoidia bacterium]
MRPTDLWMMTRIPKGLSLGALLVAGMIVLLLALAACGGKEEPVSTLKVGMISDYVTFDPPLVLGLPDLNTVQHAYDSLVMRNPDLSIQPMLAESWEPNADATQWTFNLRKGVKFSHGKDFKAEDVVFTFNRMFEVDSPLSSTLPEDMRVVVVDDYTVRFEFSQPYAPLLDSLVKYHAMITPSDVDPARFAAETFGTGPF